MKKKLIISSILATSAIVPSIVMGIDYSKDKEIYKSHKGDGKLHLSNDIKHSNLIEIFIESWDWKAFNKIFKSGKLTSLLKNFTYFDHALSSDVSTVNTKTVGQAGKDSFYPTHPDNHSTNRFYDSLTMLDQEMKKSGYERTYVNNYDMLDRESGMETACLGLPSDTQCFMEKDFWTTYYENINEIPSHKMFKYIPENIVKDKKSHYLLLNTVELHWPYRFNDKYLKTKDVSTIDSKGLAMIKQVLEFINKIPKDVYDNSKIIIWGDHSDHGDKETKLNKHRIPILFKDVRTTSSIKVDPRLISVVDVMKLRTTGVSSINRSRAYVYSGEKKAWFDSSDVLRSEENVW